jgi:high-affinity Fe2+/Pb2+ permease
VATRTRTGWAGHSSGLTGVSVVLGLVALTLAETWAAEVLLAVFIASIVLVWAVVMTDHAGFMPGHHVTG